MSLLSAYDSLAAEARSRPNIVFLFADDQRADTIRALGDPHIHTPNLDRLVREGTAFTRAYCMGGMHGAICIPSRAMMMTGRSIFRATATPTSPVIPPSLPMWPELLRKDGYATIGIGKWHNDRASFARAFSGGGPTFFGGMTDQFRVRISDFDPSGKYPTNKQRIVREFSTTLFTDAAIDFLRSEHKQPFVLYVAFTVPHDPRTPPRQFSRRYKPGDIPLPPNFLPEHPFPNGDSTVRDELLLPTPRNPEAIQEELANYYGLISDMDAQIGRILKMMEQTGQRENTIIVFAGDNGLALGSHGLLGKQNLYEHSIKVPLVMSGPGIPRGKNIDALCYLHDLAQTLCDLTGVSAPPQVEGRSLVPFIRGTVSKVRDSVFAVYRDVQRCIVEERWKLIQYPKRGRNQLFDLSRDPHETNDLAGIEAHSATIRRLREVLTASQREFGDPLAGSSTNSASTPLQATITVDANNVQGRISPLLYGQFIEFMYEGIKGGLHAELLRNRSFEEPPNAVGLSRHWERYPDDRNDDYGLSFHWDERERYPADRKGEHSLRIDVTNAVLARHGIYQSRIPVRADVTYDGYLWVKADAFSGPVSVSLEADRTDGQIYARTNIAHVQGGWTQYRFTLKPTKSDPLARFVVSVEGRGRLWIDQLSLMPGDAVDGVRPDVFSRITELRPAFIRWPGGNVAQDYRWMWGIGPRDKRVTWANLSWKNEPEPSDFGTDEFIDFCQNLNAAPAITVNVDGRGATAQEAANWVQYCNAPTNSKYGGVRAANGHAEPFKVQLWEIGNEIWGPWVRGHTDAKTYARRYKRYSAAMREVDPAIRCIAVGDNDTNWNRTVLEMAGDQIDYLAIHHYYTARETRNDPLNLMARPLHYERFYNQMREMIRQISPTRQIKLAINEWGLDLPAERQYSIESALYGARLMNVFERNSDIIEMTAVSDLVNGWPGGIIQASRHEVFVTPIYLVNQLYAQNLGRERLKTIVDSPTFDSSLEGKGIPYVDAVASRSQDQKYVFLKAVNTHRSEPIRLKVELNGAKLAHAEHFTIAPESLSVLNGFATPEAISVRTNRVSPSEQRSFELPKHSISVLKLEIR